MTRQVLAALIAVLGIGLTAFTGPEPAYAQARGSAPKSGSAPTGASGIVGQWRSPDSLVDIRADGTLLIDQVPYRYTVQGTTLNLIGIDGTLPIPFQLAGDKMTVSLNGQAVVMQRVAPGAAAAGAPGGGSNGGPAELAGKWCYMSSFSANGGGGSMTDECFTISANGTYTYHRESSRSAYAPGAYGGTASVENDAGTWGLRGNQLTVNLQSSGTAVYTLEKRNHPKNKDPMLCLEGRCFVTATQKAPWRF